jgi:hypothetical protein
MHLARHRINDGDRVAGPVDEQHVAGHVRLPHDRRQPLAPVAVQFAELRVAVFPGSGITDNLADKARKLGIRLMDYRKRAA